jgi:hypothetical protein
MIEDAALWLAAHDDLARDPRVGIAGISFAGGLGVVAAGRPALRPHVSFVLSVGGHGDLHRTLRYLFTGVLADGTRRKPHDYGVAIALLAVAVECPDLAECLDRDQTLAAMSRAAARHEALRKRKGTRKQGASSKFRPFISVPCALYLDHHV